MPQIIKIQDLHDPALNVYAHLNENQLKHYFEPVPEGIFIAESPTAIERALHAGYEPLSFLMEEKYLKTQGLFLLKWCSENLEVPIYVSTIDVLSRITGYHLTRGILGAFRRKRPASVEEICANARRIAILDNIENPTNVGAIFRSAAALGMDAVLVTPASADPLQRRAIRVSVGTVFQIPWTYIGESMTPAHAKALGLTAKSMAPAHAKALGLTAKSMAPAHAKALGLTAKSMAPAYTKATVPSAEVSPSVNGSNISKVASSLWPDQGLATLHRLGFYTVAMALRHDTLPIDDPGLCQKEKLAVILGNEGAGLPEHTISLCDATVKIPMSHGVDSLNVAAASAVMFWALTRS